MLGSNNITVFVSFLMTPPGRAGGGVGFFNHRGLLGVRKKRMKFSKKASVIPTPDWHYTFTCSDESTLFKAVMAKT